MIMALSHRLTSDMNFLRISCFCISSLVGRPICFWRWSNYKPIKGFQLFPSCIKNSDVHQVLCLTIIFSTVCLVSGSKSESLLLSGSTFWVSTSGSPFITDFHHSIWLCFVSNMDRVFPSSTKCYQYKGLRIKEKQAQIQTACSAAAAAAIYKVVQPIRLKSNDLPMLQKQSSTLTGLQSSPW